MAKAATKPTPSGYHTITPYLSVKDAAKAIEFYKRAFGAEETVRMPGPDGGVMHAEIRIGDSIIMLGDESPMGGCKSPQSLGGTTMGLHIYVKDVDAAFKKAVAAGAKVSMPLMDMFWGDRYGKLTDPFGHEWSIATHTKDLTPDEIERGAAEAMKAFPPKGGSQK
jgi:PhnB protein